MSRTAGYHHGDLRRALISTAVDAVAEAGAARMSLRDVARRAGVTHAAPKHHFGDKAGLLTAVAVDGYRLLHETLDAAHHKHASFLEVGVAYVQFAVSHPAHFEVMFQPALLHADDADLVAARQKTSAILYGEPGAGRSQTDGIAAWSLVHGLAVLWLNGALPGDHGDDPTDLAAHVAAHLNVDQQSA